jgi:hypothetical protein
MTGETFMFWYETDALFQSSFGVYGQKFSSTGVPQWADTGKAFRPFGGGQPSFINCYGKDSSAVVYFFDGVTAVNNLVKGFRVDRAGNFQWGGAITNVSSVSSSKGRLTGVFTPAGSSLLVWSDARNDDNGVYGQKVNFDGTFGNTSGVAPEGAALQFTLMQNYPNPFNPSTTLRFVLTARARTTLKVYDMLGRLVATILDEERNSGDYAIPFDGTGLASGVYFARLQAGDHTQIMKMALLK